MCLWIYVAIFLRHAGKDQVLGNGRNLNWTVNKGKTHTKTSGEILPKRFSIKIRKISKKIQTHESFSNNDLDCRSSSVVLLLVTSWNYSEKLYLWHTCEKLLLRQGFMESL